ncbi:TrbI F-type domain-containing protein [Novosphingobium sp. 9U]|uniref:TrbI F-type domain-containing protein n=1 Tax=Novosphingobium sp. 9U TaxID=2653158 RepID=UPI0012EFCAE9|nr:TrbI F-type domain-containing protein [Novosphingobium sp. 9U]VWX49838.1 Type-F conjugative transfer system protein (TrbI-Ftype) [Novosphingobium sp. 9U]
MTLVSEISADEARPATEPDLAAVSASEMPEASAVTPPPPAAPAQRAKPKRGGVSPTQILLVAAGVATLAWGAWMTRSVMDLEGVGETKFVKVQLQGLVGEYIRAQARSATPPEKISAETSAFMGELDKVVKGVSSDGKIVLINEAIVAGDVPDVTDAVRRAVYSTVAMPRAAPRQDVESAMRNYLLGAGAPTNTAPAGVPAALPNAAADGAPNGFGN